MKRFGRILGGESENDNTHKDALKRDDRPKDEELEQLIHDNAQEDLYVIRVFRKFFDTGGRAKCSFLKTFRDHIPDYTLIGALFGPGDYQLNISYTGNDGKRYHTTRLWTIDSDFVADQEDLRGARPYMTNRDSYKIGNSELSRGQPETMEFFKDLFRTYSNMISSLMVNNASGSNLEIMERFQEQIGNMMIKNAESQQKLIQRITAQKLEIEEPEDEPNPIYQILKALWDRYGEQLLNAPSFIQKRVRNEFAKRPEFEALTNDPDQFSDAYNMLVERDGVKREKIDRLLELAGIEVQSVEQPSENSDQHTEKNQKQG